ncbi:transmembrane protein, putative (macronuclear) [Tetrahymena thermophila SB210]|uniref:Transmembrane protein, putative n=1 Tax=Tetrahymena thermophila (strain SB210) TaxID=312017 RepID=Q23Q72_TETTS|nr:transmembrane protein, putative [Tetrahymena thermophila SB210]EAR98712.2 transmembrane protein, putative [Tetrahymena thermophila SB210]|eukprot:XP_001018957.2 transmembrane protein, putative [Tetrahymena thermophila SB210]
MKQKIFVEKYHIRNIFFNNQQKTSIKLKQRKYFSLATISKYYINQNQILEKLKQFFLIKKGEKNRQYFNLEDKKSVLSNSPTRISICEQAQSRLNLRPTIIAVVINSTHKFESLFKDKKTQEKRRTHRIKLTETKQKISRVFLISSPTLSKWFQRKTIFIIIIIMFQRYFSILYSISSVYIYTYIFYNSLQLTKIYLISYSISYKINLL